MHLQPIDWIIVAATLLICFVPALFFGKRAGQEHFGVLRLGPLGAVVAGGPFDGGDHVQQRHAESGHRHRPRKFGVAGNWLWWAFVLTGVATVFFYARLWRRSGVMTDLEFYELRYSGKAASVVRGFRAVYLGLFFNCFIMAHGEPGGVQDRQHSLRPAPAGRRCSSAAC